MSTHHTTGAELQTLRELCGLSRDTLAGLCGVQARTVKHWEGGRSGVPDDVATMARTLARWVAAEAAEIVAQSLAERASHGGPVVLLRYREAAHLPGERKNGASMPTEAHGAALARVVLALRQQNPDEPPRVVWFDPAPYFAWLEAAGFAPGHGDTAAQRSRWARLQALPSQAIPPRGDQPPPAYP
jgi:transcriptional regulator with XRE-family HTH domain